MLNNNTKILLLILILTASSVLFAQEKRIKLVGLEVGIYSLMPATNDYSFVRKNAGTTYLSDKIYLDGINNTGYFGFKFEILSKNKRFSLLTGLRYTYTSSMLKADSYNDIESYVLFHHESTDHSNEFLRVQKIFEKKSFIGIPVAIRYAPLMHSSGKFEGFTKLTFQLNANIHTSKDVVFYNDEMEKYTDAITDNFKDPSIVSGMMFLSYGVRVGDIEKLSVAFEMISPGFGIFGEASSLFESSTGIGAQLTIQKAF